MESGYNLTNLPLDADIKLARELLSKEYNINLDTYKGIVGGADVWVSKYNKELIITQFKKANEITKKNLDSFINSIKEEAKKRNPSKYILVYFHNKVIPEFIELNHIIKDTDFIFCNFSWIKEQLRKYPVIAEKFNINPASYLDENTEEQTQNKESNVNNSKDFSKIDQLINSGKKFFVAGHSWGTGKENDQMERFLSDALWEQGYDEKNTAAVNSAKQGDVLFLKSTYRPGKGNFLRVKGIGVVKENSGNGQLLKVAWYKFKKPEHIDIDRVGAYSRAFQKVSDVNSILIIKEISEEIDDIISIIKKLDKNYYEKVTNLESKRYWWIKAQKEFVFDDFSVGSIISEDFTPIEGNAYSVQNGDLGIIYQESNLGKTKVVIEITELPDKSKSVVNSKIIYKFKENEQQTFDELLTLEYFSKSEVAAFNNQKSISQLTYDEFEEVCSKSQFLKEPEENIPEATKTILDNDGAYTTEDLLDIENDVRSFALLLASKEIKPPLAVALFGKWGSGKSFFMEHLSKRVDELSINQGFLEEGEENIESKEKPKEDAFCKGIAQIKFNAWSYLDANLWAGLVTNIFSKLDEYITGDNVKEGEKRIVHNEFSESLAIVQDEKIIISKEIDELKTDKNKIGKTLEKLEEGKEDLHKKIIKQSIEDLKKEARKHTAEIEQDVKAQLDSYGISQQRIEELSPTALLDEVGSWVTFINNIGKFNKRSGTVAVIIITLLLAYAVLLLYNVVPGGFLAKLKELITMKTAFLIGMVGPFFTKVYASYVKFKKVLKPVIDYKNKFNESFDRVKQEYDIKLNTFSTEISEKEREIKEKQNELINVNTQIEHYEFELNHSVTKRAFNNFIKRKSKDESYEKHLGLISIIRKDFETLSGLFEEINIPDDIKPIEKAKLEERKKKSDKFRSHFKKPLDRIILYIDDLDRCDDEKVLDVIQAVHLLMAFPLFNVVVGVDKRCVNNALIYKNLLQYSKFATIDKIEKLGIHVISPSEYLEKIFQIPFQLDDPSEKNIQRMVDNFLKDQVEKKTKDVEIHLEDKLPEIKEELNAFEQVEEKPKAKIKDEAPEKDDDEEVIEKKKIVTPQDLKLTQEEFDLLKEMIWLVGTVPRTIKRFLNIYRIVRAHQDLEIDETQKREEYLAIMFILAINIGENKKHAPELMKCIESNKDLKLNDIVDHRDLKDSKDEFKYFNEVRNKIERTKSIQDLNQMKAGVLSKHIPLVGRFSFGSIESNGDENNIQEQQKVREEINAE